MPFLKERAAATFAARFWSKVNKDGPLPPLRPDLGPCWIWTASLDRNGYGQFAIIKLDGRRTMAKAHRIGFETEYGPQPAGGTFCHQCDTPPCVRAAHLVYADDARNAADRFRADTLPNKLTAAQVHEIRRRLMDGEQGAAIGREFGVTKSTIHAIKQGRTWRLLEGAAMTSTCAVCGKTFGREDIGRCPYCSLEICRDCQVLHRCTGRGR